ncbi:hypothetical protein PIB30_040972 [Stylosanthes scabra]|uniref:GH16 domain-containing protein n=1 Tax=Stylosanthes scabra TaxID=79078 RepID=A0ABU6UHY3_9FABA|nr:hypothetical protein [Stylosanthes scabra]
MFLCQSSGSAFRSKEQYLFGRMDMQLKLNSGDSAGTVTAYYVRIIDLGVSIFYLLNSEGPNHDEIDFEFLECSTTLENSAAMVYNNSWQTQDLNANDRRLLRWVQRYYMV